MPFIGKKPAQTAVEKLRADLANPNKIVACPGVYDGYTARICLNAGHETLYMTGAGTVMSRLGMPDLGVASLNDMVDHARMIANINPSVPVIADADTGYGGPLMVGRTVAAYMRAGVAALHLEDQVVNKRCGHLKNKALVSEDEYISRIRAAAMAREANHGDIVIIARTDALQSLGYDAAVQRLKKAVEAGADVAFLEGVNNVEECKRVVEEMKPVPCLFNCVHGGVSPELSVGQAKEIGFKIIIFPAFCVAPVYGVLKGLAEDLLKTGEPSKLEVQYPPKALFEVCGLDDCMEFDIKAGGKLYGEGV